MDDYLDLSTFDPNLDIPVYDASAINASDLAVLVASDIGAGINLDEILPDVSFSWNLDPSEFTDYGNFSLSDTSFMDSINLAYEMPTSISDWLGSGVLGADVFDMRSFKASIDLQMYNGVSVLDTLNTGSIGPTMDNLDSLLEEKYDYRDITQEAINDMGFENPDFEQYSGWEDWSKDKADGSEATNWDPSTDMTFQATYTDNEYKAIESMYAFDPENAERLEMSIWGGGTIESITYGSNGYVNVTIDMPNDFLGAIKGIMTGEGVNLITRLLTGGSLGAISISPITGVLLITGVLGSAFNKETTFVTNGNNVDSSGFTAAIDGIAEHLGINSGNGLTDSGKQITQLIEVGYNLPSIIDGIVGGMRGLSIGLQIGNIGLAVNGVVNLLKGLSVIQKVTVILGQGSTDQLGNTSTYLQQIDIQKRIDLIMVDAQEYQDLNNEITKSLVNLTISQVLTAYTQGVDASLSEVKRLTIDSVGSLAGSTKWNNPYAGARYFSPYSKLMPKVFASNKLLGDPKADWFNNHIALTERHNSKFNQFAGNRDFISSMFTPFTF